MFTFEYQTTKIKSFLKRNTWADKVKIRKATKIFYAKRVLGHYDKHEILIKNRVLALYPYPPD